MTKAVRAKPVQALLRNDKLALNSTCLDYKIRIQFRKQGIWCLKHLAEDNLAYGKGFNTKRVRQ